MCALGVRVDLPCVVYALELGCGAGIVDVDRRPPGGVVMTGTTSRLS